MNNDMLAAAIVWAAEEELKEDGRRYKKAAVKYEAAVIGALKRVDNKEFGIMLQRLGEGTADEVVKALNELTADTKNEKPELLLLS